VVHHGERLALIVEAGQYLGGVHAELHNLKGDPPANWLKLLGQVHSAHPPFAYGSKDVIAAEVVILGR
jgi:hypothetical protein